MFFFLSIYIKIQVIECQNHIKKHTLNRVNYHKDK